MRSDILLKRIAKKANAPELLWKTKPLPDRCMVWTGAYLPGGFRMRKDFDHYECVKIKSSSRVLFQGKRTSVPRVLHILREAPTSPFRGRQTCPTPLCINPQHWVFEPITSDDPSDELEFVYDPDTWTPEEVQERLDTYWLHNPRHPLNYDHHLLVDIPRDLLP